MNLVYGERVYIDDSVKHPGRAKKRLQNGKYEPCLYLITLSATPGNMLEIFSSIFLRQTLFRQRCQPVVGMAVGKKRAIELMTRILADTYQQRRDYRADLFLKGEG